MTVRHTRLLAAAAALALASPSAASAQAAPIAPGTQIVDTAGNPVGSVTSVTGDQVVVKTDKVEVQLPATSFTPNEGKLLFALTREQLNTQTQQALAEANAKLVAGTSVYGQNGTLAGTIEAIDAETVTVKLTGGKLIRMPRASIAPGPQGAVLGVSAAELQRLAEQGS
nr:hypothetical protein [uncultured Sphingomonas sp.]